MTHNKSLPTTMVELENVESQETRGEKCPAESI